HPRPCGRRHELDLALVRRGRLPAAGLRRQPDRGVGRRLPLQRPSRHGRAPAPELRPGGGAGLRDPGHAASFCQQPVGSAGPRRDPPAGRSRGLRGLRQGRRGPPGAPPRQRRGKPMSRAARRHRAKAPTPPIEVQAGRSRPLGMSPARFLRDYWQKRPVLIRGAFPGFVSPIEPEDLAGLACEELALSRLIRHDRASDGWDVGTGPFPEELFPTLGERDWTLLVQDVDKWDADVAALLAHFDFIPRWRIDDIMVSFAATGGSVGAHIDQYDVFLLQGQGHRRWQIDAGPNPPLGFRDDVELKLLRRFTPTHDWVLAPGDMLYLPPGVPHHGVAEDSCLTFSVGMRAPSAAELMGDYIDTLAADADEALRYADPDLAPPTHPDEIDAAAMARVVEAL